MRPRESVALSLLASSALLCAVLLPLSSSPASAEGATWPPVWQSAGVGAEVINQPPELSAGGYSPSDPATYNRNTYFVFSAHYYDPDGDRAVEIRVVIEGSGVHAMTLTSGSAADGDYSYTTRLGPGAHRFYFHSNDGHGGGARLPAEGSFAGPFLIWAAIADNASWVDTAGVKVAVRASGASAVYLKNTYAEAWSGPFSYPAGADLAEIPWNLAPGADGPRRVYAYCVTTEEQPSNVFVDDICLDTTSALAIKYFTINRGAATTANRVAELRIYPDCATLVRFRNSPVAEWIEYWLDRCDFGQAEWLLDEGPDGLRRVYVQAQDHHGNLSPVVSDSIVLQRPPALMGQVRARDSGTPLAGATVNLYVDWTPAGSVVAAAPYAVYTFGNEVPSGVYRVVASMPGYVRQGRENIGVTEGTTTYVNFNLAISGRLTGQVRNRATGAPIVGATVNAYSGDRLWATATTSAPYGIYEITSDLPAGVFLVQATSLGFDAQLKTNIAVTAGATTYVNFNLASGG